MQYLADIGVALLAAAALLLALSVCSRVRFARHATTFRCKLGRLTRRPWHRRECLRWSHGTTRARWVSDVLLIQDGPLRMRTRSIRAQLPIGARIGVEQSESVRGLGSRPQTLWIDSATGSPVKLAVRERDRILLAGPFLAAAIAGLPAAPRTDRRRRT